VGRAIATMVRPVERYDRLSELANCNRDVN